MATVNKIKISLRCDELSNWTAKNPVLNNGELAIVNDAGNQLFKIGNGLSTFNQLPFFNENEVKTTTLSAQDVVAKSVSQGLKAKATPLGFAAGAFLSANANFSQALGYNAETKADDTYAFVWNGDDARALLDYYQSHGKGTFSINPINGLQGVFIGEDSLCAVFDDYWKKSETSSAIELSDEFAKKQDKLPADPDDTEFVAKIDASGATQRSDVKLSALQTVTANVRSTYFVEFDSPLGYGSLFPVKFKNTDPYDGYWEFYQTYERRVGQFNGTVDLIEMKDQGDVLCCYLKSSPTSPVPIEGDILSNENLTWEEFERIKHYEFTMLGYPCTMDLKTYYDANGYSRASIDKLFAEKTQLSDYYAKAETSSATELAAKFNTLSTYSETAAQLSNDGYLTAHQSLDNYYTKGETSSDVELQNKFGTLSTYAEVAKQLSNDSYLTAHQSLAEYWKKTETSSATEIAQARARLEEQIHERLLSNDISDYAKIWIDTPELARYDDLSVIKLTYEDYRALAIEDKALSNALYVLCADFFDCFGERIINVAEPEEDGDATPKIYVDKKLVAGQLSTVEDEEAEEGQRIEASLSCMPGLSVVHIDLASYSTILSGQTANKDTIYFLEQEDINAFDQRITNLADGTKATDAATVGQLNAALGNINTILEALN